MTFFIRIAADCGLAISLPVVAVCFYRVQRSAAAPGSGVLKCISRKFFLSTKA